MTEWLEVAAADDMAVGDKRVVEGGEGPILVTRLEDGFYAVHGICSHMYAELEDGEVDADGQIACPLHDAHFDVRTGEALTPPAFEALATYTVEVRDGTVYVADEPSEA